MGDILDRGHIENGSLRTGPLSEMQATPYGPPVSKVAVYNWQMVDKPGQFRLVHKAELKIDHDYQRKNINNKRLNEIASEWSWVALAAIVVGRRPDGSLWVVDGQHRVLAARKRSDVAELPCMVFDTVGSTDEAKGFLRVQLNRTTLKTFDKFDALVMSSDKHAIATRDMIEGSGYEITRHGGGDLRNKVKCVGTIYKAVQLDDEAAQVAWDAAVKICDRRCIHENVFEGLFYAERWLVRQRFASISDDHRLMSTLMKAGPDGIQKSIARVRSYLGKGGGKVCGQGVIELLNKGRQVKNRIPPLYDDFDNEEVI